MRRWKGVGDLVAELNVVSCRTMSGRISKRLERDMSRKRRLTFFSLADI